MGITGYVPFYNARETVLAAVHSLREQRPAIDEVFAIDDGSTDGGAELLESAGVRVIRQPRNLGRGAARHRAMEEARNEFVLSCDATNVLPPTFARDALAWFQDPSVAAVFGVIEDPTPRGVVARWRSRHLFKADVPRRVVHNALLITFGTMVRTQAVAAVGGFDPKLSHSEDAELGERLLSAGYDVIADPKLKIVCNTNNTLTQVLERYWRWYAGKDEVFDADTYLRQLAFSFRTMAWNDLRAGDPLSAFVSLMTPQYRLYRHLRTRRASAARAASNQTSNDDGRVASRTPVGGLFR